MVRSENCPLDKVLAKTLSPSLFAMTDGFDVWVGIGKESANWGNGNDRWERQLRFRFCSESKVTCND
jgi:hypothetical protein